MSDGFTKVNLKGDVEDSATKFGLAPDMEARFANDDLELEHSGLSYQAVAPGKRQPFGHNQKEQEEVFLIVGGSGRAKLDDEIVEVEELDAIRVSPQTMRALEAGSDGLQFVVIGAPRTGPTADDVDRMEQGWWDD
jgi:mannose-6-phosphate isomerase-like protein (cupin superfamily)